MRARVIAGAVLALVVGVLLVPAAANASSSPPTLAWSPTTSTGTFDFSGQSAGVSQTFTLTNSGGSATSALVISISPSPGAFTITADLCNGTSLGPRKSCTVTVQYSPAGGSDSATLSAVSKKPSASAGLALKGSLAQDLTVSKTATASFTRTFTWGISKSVDNSRQDVFAGSSATFHYTVSVTHDTGTDGNWQVEGTITVANPNSFAVSGVIVIDTVDNGGSCTVTGGPSSIAAHGSASFPYTCTYASAPDPGSGTNTATATWPGFGSPDTSASGTAGFDFASVSPTAADGTISVSDTLGGVLGTVSSTDASPTTFSYPTTFTDPAGSCTSHDNTATFTTNSTGTTGSASQSVQVCVHYDLSLSPGTLVLTSGGVKSYEDSITPGAMKTYTVTNNGSSTTAALSFVNNDLSTFTLGSDNCTGKTLASGGSCTFTITAPASGPAGGNISLQAGTVPELNLGVVLSG